MSFYFNMANDVESPGSMGTQILSFKSGSEGFKVVGKADILYSVHMVPSGLRRIKWCSDCVMVRSTSKTASVVRCNYYPLV